MHKEDVIDLKQVEEDIKTGIFPFTKLPYWKGCPKTYEEFKELLKNG